MSDGTIALIVVGSIVGYLAIAGACYAFIVETHNVGYLDLWPEFASAFWPIALPVMLAKHITQRTIRAAKAPRIPRAEARK